MTNTAAAFANDRSNVILVIASLVALPPALRITAWPSSGPKNCSGTQRGSRQVTGGELMSVWITAIQVGFAGQLGRVGNRRMMNTPPALMVTARICSIVKGFFHVSANLRLFSRRVWSLESTYAIFAVLFGDVPE